MGLLVACVVCVLLALSFPGIVSKLEDKLTKCGDFFFEEESPLIHGILENSEPQNNDYRVVCQKYKNKIRYATLYDTGKKIPLFSAYKYTGTKVFVKQESLQTWMIELELEPKDAEMSVPFENQARNKDYWIKNTYKYFPGTLFSMSHTADEETAESILTLTNSVPQTNGFRDGIWNLVDQTTKESMENDCIDNNDNLVAYVMTGAVPGNTMLNQRVNVPSYMWTAFCCYNSTTTSWVSKAYYTENKRKKATKIKLKSLEDLQGFLTTKLGGKVELFKNNCSLDDS
ncbi:Endonuclease domain-containing 1 protein [Triplophysa tibetana]|uniref:Endonuclease domain-containing 1 protein n=1 Tax=Triplophysa tibetana TaxID=1572043 RepID=A0A5A9NJ07_9TELE|nr:Endonuclease domain-containing 1 protein [Triplophysa tibetana]